MSPRRLLTATILAFTLAMLARPGAVLAHEGEMMAELDGPSVVNPDDTMGSGSPALGDLHLHFDHDVLVFDAELHVDGIMPAELDGSHGPNGSAILVEMGGPTERGPILIDLHWYATAGFGSITPTADGFILTASFPLTESQGLYDLTAATGLDAHEAFEEMEEGNSYIVVYSDAHPDGDIRGQISIVTTATETTSWGAVKGLYQ